MVLILLCLLLYCTLLSYYNDKCFNLRVVSCCMDLEQGKNTPLISCYCKVTYIYL